ncbi:MAG: M20 family metallo-hydrolase [Thermodesulfobacteriota bacterium]
MLKEVFDRIDGWRDQVISLQEELTARVALGTQNGGTGEHDKTNYLHGKILALKPDLMEEVRAPDQKAQDGYRPNLVARWDGSKGGPTTWVLSHMDIVPPGDPTLWETDPFRLTVEGDRIIGRGVEDNQHGIVSSYLAVQAVLETGRRPVRSMGLVFVADEETGSEYGLEYLLRHRKGIFSPQDLIVVPDWGNEQGSMIEVAEKSMLWLRFTVKGKQCHASTPHEGKNSLYGAARLIIELDRLKREYAFEDRLFRPSVSTFEPTKIEANVPNVNTIPGKDTFYVDCRILPRYRVGEVLFRAKAIAAEVAGSLEVSIEVEPIYLQEATEPTPADAPVVQALSRAIREVKGLDAVPTGIGGGTVAAFFRRAGLPAAVWLTESATAHQPNEYCLVSNLLGDAKVLACLFMDPL